MNAVQNQFSLTDASLKNPSAIRRSVTGSGHFWALLCGVLLSACSAGAQLVISSFDTAGILEWSNSLPNASVFSVEWSGPLSNQTWRGSWDGLSNIPATNGSSYRVQVPMAYRLVAQTNVLRSRWTLLFYMMADNNLENDFVTKFVDLARWTSDTNVQLVVQFARNGLDTRYGNWQGCERFVVTNGMVPTRENALQDWGDGSGGRRVNMSDPATLAAFLDWAMVRHPADRYALFVGDHGFGWKGFGVCDSYADSFMYIHELARVLKQARARVDCLFLDACLMGMAEVVSELQNSGPGYLLISENYGESDWPYGLALEGLQANPQWTPREFSTDVNERLWTYYSQSNVVTKITLCTADLSLVPTLVSNTASFVAGVLDMDVPLAEVQDRARDAMASITNLLLVRHLGPDWDGIANGLSVYFPLKEGTYKPAYFDEYQPRRARFALESGWRSMLATYYDPMMSPPFHPQLMSVRAGMTNLIDSPGENIDLYDFLKRFAEAAP